MAYLAELERVLRQAARATAGRSVDDLKTSPQAG
jgi:hypothetical protein